MSKDYFAQRIVCLTEEPTEILYLLGEEHRIVGISGFTTRPPIARKTKPKVSTFLDADIKKIIDLKPDLVIGFSDIQANIAQKLIAEGITVYINNHRSIEEIFKIIVWLGGIVGKQDKAVELVENIKANLKLICTENQVKKNKPKVYFEEWNEPIITGITWVSEIIEMAGGIDIFKNKANKSLAKNRIIEDSNEIVEKNPDIIFVSWCGKKFQKKIMIERKGWDKINAVQNNCIYEIKSDIILQPGPASLTEGIAAMVGYIKEWHKKQR